MMNIIPATPMSPANKKNSLACDSIAFVSAIIRTIMFPNDTVNNQKLVSTDFMLGGA